MADSAYGSRKCRRGAVSILCCVATAAVAAASACSNEPEPAVINTVRLNLDFGSGVTLSTANYDLTGPGGFRRIGSLPVGDQPTVTATFQNLPPGRGYNIEVTGTATDDASSCHGSMTFAVMGSMTTTLQVPLVCSGIASI